VIYAPARRFAPGRSGLVLTCEHATAALPPGYAWPPEDRWLAGTHWAVDLGIAEITCMLAEQLETTAVLAGFSRLLCDANRGFDEPSWLRTHAEGRPIALNQDVDAAERARRRVHYDAFHAEVAAVVAEGPCHTVLSMHSFTPQYEDQPPRWMEVGVLFDREEALAEQLGAALARAGIRVALNEPYSGKGGLMYSCETHAGPNRRPLELEIRQDLADDPLWRRAVVPTLAAALREVGVG
jgi:predicted N-formylglutamate amidohydrolase